jgi:hypothetical protein
MANAFAWFFLSLCLNPQAVAADEKRDSSAKPRYALAKALNTICKPFTDNLNAVGQVEFDTCQSRLSDQHPRFSRPRWAEIPFDLNLAEKMVKRAWEINHPAKADVLWKEWLQDTEAARNSGKAKMWQLQADLDGDGGIETIVRMNYGFRFRKSGEMRRRQIDGCEYLDSALYMTRGGELVKHFNANHSVQDLMYDSASNRHFLIESSTLPIAGTGIWGRGHPTFVVGATRGVALYEVKPRLGPIAICNIQWIPGDRAANAPTSK